MNYKKQLITLALATALLLPQALFAAVDFQVKVINRADNSPVADAQVIVQEIRKKFRTNQKGTVKIQVPRPGIYTFRLILASGDFQVLRKDVSGSGVEIQLFTGKANKGGGNQVVGGDGDGISVTGKREKSKLSRYQVRLDEIKRMPGTFGEALRGLETLPGISTPSFGAGDIVVRGANSNANSYLLDGLPIGYAFHFLGLNSVIHNDMIKTIDLYTGAYPAKFGDATGGIISIETVDDVKKFGGHMTFSLWSTNAIFQGPLFMDKGYWMVAGRGSYLDKFFNALNLTPEGVRLPKYGDAQVKLHYVLTPQQALDFYILGAKDTFGVNVATTTEWDPTTEADSRFVGARLNQDLAFQTEAIRHIWRPGTRLRNTATLIYHETLFYIDGNIGAFEAKNTISDAYVSFKDELDWEVVKKHIFLDVGFEGRRLFYKNVGKSLRLIDPNDPTPDFYNTTDPDFVTIPIDDKNRSSYNTAHAMLTFKAKGFEFKPGVRVSAFGQTNHRVVDPSGTISYTLPTKTTFIAGAGVYHRAPDSFTYSPSSGNPNLKMERAEHYGGGVEQVFGNWTFKIEGFKHYFTDQIVADPYGTIAVRANTDAYKKYEEPWLYNDRLAYSNDGTGYAEGVEIYIKKGNPPNKNGWYGWISYTNSWSYRNTHQHEATTAETNTIYSANERRIISQYDNTEDTYATFDRRHILNIVLGWKITRAWQIGARFKYNSSVPHDEIVGDNGGTVVSNGRVVFDPTYKRNYVTDKLERNTVRQKDTHYLSVRLDHFIHYGWGFGNVFVELINVYVRQNPEGFDWNSSLPYSSTNPSTVHSFLNVEQQSGGKTIRGPLFNIGIEVKF